MRYFDHDTSASTDPKIMSLRLSHGGAAVDCYWVIAEQIYREEKPLNLYGNPVGFSLITHLVSGSVSEVKKWVETMLVLGLLYRCGDNGEYVISERMESNIDGYHAKAKTARQNGAKGGRPKKTQSVSKKKPAGLQEKKRKEKKSVGFDSSQNPTLTPSENSVEKDADFTGETPTCASCGEVVVFNPDAMAFVCRTCGALHGVDEVVFR